MSAGPGLWERFCLVGNNFFFCALCVCMCVCVCVCEYAIVGTVTVGGCALSLSLSHREYGIHSGRGS